MYLTLNSLSDVRLRFKRNVNNFLNRFIFAGKSLESIVRHFPSNVTHLNVLLFRHHKKNTHTRLFNWVLSVPRF